MLRDWARTVEGLGFDLLMVSDHVVVTPDVAEQYPAPFYEPFTTLSWLAGVTERITLGTTVLIAPYRHPLLVARMAANLNDLSGGRFVLGVGVGWARQEFEALGVPFRPQGKADRRADHGGARGVAGRGLPRGPHPDLGGRHSDGALRRAVRLGDAWHPLRQTPGGWQESLARLRKIAAEEERPLPELAPRILLRLTDEPFGDRRAGRGHDRAGHRRPRTLRADGAHAVVLDPFIGDPEETRHPEAAWHALATVRKSTEGVPVNGTNTCDGRSRWRPRRGRAATRRSGRCWSVPDGSVLAEERNSCLTDNDITAHPELKLARWAAQSLDPAVAAGTTMYTSCEPCGMCAGALARSGIGHVVFALPAAKPSRFVPVPTDGPHLQDEAKVPVEGYYK